ncbi:DNA polymerase III subunit gamma/tau [Geminisphaera colitermitum]|uniref:DNA polymerase III subunit gamma/tau n=1 Tax=Geminisphaera colitermitum TaxID=1148786 RepID=UPI000158CE51|nr:DNA polymerase III subunit gamma/tau [Geminisphaera colitermitum]
MSHVPLPWPSAVDGTPAVAVIERAIDRRRLSHSLLITGPDHELLASVAYTLSDRLLNPPTHPAAARRPIHADTGSHPDLFELRPAGKMRQIGAEATRELIGKTQVSSTAAPCKVAIIHECDRMHVSAANIFLKTLEEPPANTTLLLLTTRPYALLPTIRSRCLNFRFPDPGQHTPPDGWEAWRQDYHAWLAKLTGGAAATGKKAVADALLGVYGLTARFGAILDFATADLWKKEKAHLPEDLKEEEREAIETGLSKGLRARLFTDIEQTTTTFAREALLTNGDTTMRRSITEAIAQLEHQVGLLNLNLDESAALESFLLQSLRIWTRPGKPATPRA